MQVNTFPEIRRLRRTVENLRDRRGDMEVRLSRIEDLLAHLLEKEVARLEVDARHSDFWPED